MPVLGSYTMGVGGSAGGRMTALWGKVAVCT